MLFRIALHRISAFLSHYLQFSAPSFSFEFRFNSYINLLPFLNRRLAIHHSEKMALGGMAIDFLRGCQYEAGFDFVYKGTDDEMKDARISLPSSKQFIDDGYVELLDDEILLIAVFQERIKGVRLVKHDFVVMQTVNGAYSIDRFVNETILRYAEDTETLLRNGPSGKREGCKMISQLKKGKGTVADVVLMMHDEGLSSKSYNLLFNNCKTTAWAVFDKFQDKAKSMTQKVKKTISTGFFESCRRINRFVTMSF